MRRPLLVAAVATLLGAAPLAAQGYRIRVDSRVQSVAFRGVELDSIPRAAAVAGPNGPATADGFDVVCGVDAFCRFFRPGAVLHAVPFTLQASGTMWGFGVPGLRLRLNARVVSDLGDEATWPGTEPAVQLLEGYAEYARGGLTARAGRQLVSGRLGIVGFDGGRVQLRSGATGVEGEVYAGWGLATGVALPVSSPVLNPLDEFQPRQRSIVAGAGVGYTHRLGDVRVDYERELDGETRTFFSERAALSTNVRPAPGWTVTGGAEYDLDYGWWGSADLALWYTRGPVTADLGIARYRPHFDLWTIWGAFSPVPYHSARGEVWVKPIRQLQVRVRGERYGYASTDASTPLVTAEDRGWRFGLGATYTLAAWRVDAGYHAEFGPGAASRGIEGSLGYAPSERLAVTLRGAALLRPLEFRYDDSNVNLVGGDVVWTVREALRVTGGAEYYWERRRRPDAANFDWTQTRLHAGVSLLFGSNADRMPLPPGRRPPRTGMR
ncbi:MAG TPA: hypothetical protein VFS40_11310 [Gemmatimonadales bacterium]|nr:hypothetical protein [Gemmatimonadales bacterium]